jgi:hypothetical protein
MENVGISNGHLVCYVNEYLVYFEIIGVFFRFGFIVSGNPGPEKGQSSCCNAPQLVHTIVTVSEQGCQITIFQTENTNLGKF